MGPNGPVRLSLAITHVNTRPDRRAHVANMLRKMGGPDALNRDTVRWQVTVDSGKGLWPNHWRSWASGMMASGATHHMVMEDDLTLCEDFIEGVREAISWAPHGPISIYSNRKVIEECRRVGSSWARVEDGMWGQALILPTEQVTEFIRWDREYLRPDAFAYDTRLVMWSLSTGKGIWCTVPSLVDHAGAASSTIGYSDARRISRWFIGEDVSALSVDWSKGVEDPPRDQDKRLSWYKGKGLWRVEPE